MKNIPNRVILDYFLVSFGLFLMIVFLEPFGTRDFLRNNGPLYYVYVIEALAFFAFFMVGECVATYCFRMPYDISQPWSYQIRRLVCIAVPDIFLNVVFDGLYTSILKFGLEKWYYHWLDLDGTFTLKWTVKDFQEVFGVAVFVVLYFVIIIRSRMQKYQIEELASLNRSLADTQGSDIKKSETEAITIQGDGRDSLTVSPDDIIYVESVGNYLNFVYYQDLGISDKKLRGALKDVELILEPFTNILHIHRAFLVNINHIESVSGNSAGYKLKMKGTDAVLPVSKANIKIFRERVEDK